MDKTLDYEVVSSETRQCESCGATYGPKRHWQRFCSRRCRTRAWEALHPRVTLMPGGTIGALRVEPVASGALVKVKESAEAGGA